MPDEKDLDVMRSPSRTLIRSLADHSAVRYLVVGGLAFVVDFGLVFFFYQKIGWPLWLATGAGFIASFAVNYTLQRIFSFSSRAAHGGALLRYSLLVAVNTLLTIAIVTLLNSTILGWAGGKIIATIATMVGNYFAYRHWVFSTHRDAGKEE